MTRPSGSIKKSRPETATLERARERAERLLTEAGVPDAAHDACLLLQELTGLDRGRLHLARDRALDAPAAQRLEEWIRRRARREPLQHVVGTAHFFGREFEIDARALVPRPETERLVALALAVEAPRDARVADLGTGSGCIAVSLALERPGFVIDAVDCSRSALELAAQNVSRHRVRVRLHEADFGDVPESWRGAFDVVVSNPPYVALGQHGGLEPEVREHDPREALVAGPTGYEAFERVAPAAHMMLRPTGRLLLEIGHGQAGRARELVEAAGFDVDDVVADWNGIPRVLIARMRQVAA